VQDDEFVLVPMCQIDSLKCFFKVFSNVGKY
jgi:hypothetical protein